MLLVLDVDFYIPDIMLEVLNRFNPFSIGVARRQDVKYGDPPPVLGHRRQ